MICLPLLFVQVSCKTVGAVSQDSENKCRLYISHKSFQFCLQNAPCWGLQSHVQSSSALVTCFEEVWRQVRPLLRFVAVLMKSLKCMHEYVCRGRSRPIPPSATTNSKDSNFSQAVNRDHTFLRISKSKKWVWPVRQRCTKKSYYYWTNVFLLFKEKDIVLN